MDFNIPGDSVDVNVTPDKRTILVHAEMHVIDGLRVSPVLRADGCLIS